MSQLWMLFVTLFCGLVLAVKALEECGSECYPSEWKDPDLDEDSEESDEELERFSFFNTIYKVSLRTTNEAKFLLYTRGNEDAPEEYDINSEKMFVNFDKNKKTKILIHGWLNSGDSTFNTVLKDAFINNFDYNVIVVDWSAGSGNILYPIAAKSVPRVAEVVADFIDRLVKEYGLKTKDLHVLGFSLGAHVSGIAGMQITTGKLGRITGLDPAYPMFKKADEHNRLSTYSADVVDIIHTCGRLLGIFSPIGHVDFYPNKGTFPQPRCSRMDLSGECSHRRSYELYAQSITEEGGIVATECSNYNMFQDGLCDGNKQTKIGEELDLTSTGVYYFSYN